MSLAKHGSATDPQLYSYLTLGTIFWVTVMLIGTRLKFSTVNLTKISEFAIFEDLARPDNFPDLDLSSKLQAMRENR